MRVCKEISQNLQRLLATHVIGIIANFTEPVILFQIYPCLMEKCSIFGHLFRPKFIE